LAEIVVADLGCVLLGRLAVDDGHPSIRINVSELQTAAGCGDRYSERTDAEVAKRQR